MNRRDFLKLSLCSATLFGSALPFKFSSAALGSYQRALVNVMLLGGADFRYLFVPNPTKDPLYGLKFWQSRQPIYNAYSNDPKYPQYSIFGEAWLDLYQAPNDTAATFGIHKNAGWLLDQYNAGNVAIICNVAASTNRQHDHSQLIMNTGDLDASMYVSDRDGWGGRLAEVIGTGNTVAVTNDISVFCSGTNPGNRNANVIHANDTRNFGLSTGTGNVNSMYRGTARALKNYYAAKRIEATSKPDSWPYHKFLQHEKILREFGEPFMQRLVSDAPEQPLSLRQLYDNSYADMNLHSTYFGKQCASLYDSFVGADLFKLRMASMEFPGWDTHRQLRSTFESKISDVFGIGKGLDALTTELGSLSQEAIDNTVFVFTTDFGRQLKANGDGGTDHGRGNYMLVVGNAVNGGVYGEMFPRSEIADIGGGETRYDQLGTDIEGRTSFERVLAQVCDWVEPGSGTKVFPNTLKNDLNQYPDGPILEEGVDLSTLFA